MFAFIQRLQEPAPRSAGTMAAWPGNVSLSPTNGKVTRLPLSNSFRMTLTVRLSIMSAAVPLSFSVPSRERLE
jgi:hypothetical protein